MVEVCTATMALKNDQQYGCQTGNNLKKKSRDLNRNSSRFFSNKKINRLTCPAMAATQLPAFGYCNVRLILSCCSSFFQKYITMCKPQVKAETAKKLVLEFISITERDINNIKIPDEYLKLTIQEI
jgi:hypothetical protein